MSPIAEVCREVADDAWRKIANIVDTSDTSDKTGENKQFSKKCMELFELRFVALLYFLSSCYCSDKGIARFLDRKKDADELGIPADFYVKNTLLFHSVYELMKTNEKTIIELEWAISPDRDICGYNEEINKALNESVYNLPSKIQDRVVDDTRQRYSKVDWFYNLQSITFANHDEEPDIYESDTQFERLGKRIACDYYYDLVDNMRMWIHKEDDYYNEYYFPKDEQNPWEQLKDDIDHGEPPYCEPYFMYVCLNRLEKLDDNIQYLIWVLVGENQIYRENNPYDCDLKTLDEEIAMQIFKQFYSEAEKELAKEG